MTDSKNTPDYDDANMNTKEFLERLNAGTDSGLAELFDRYFEKLCSYASRKISPNFDSEADSVVMSVLGSMVRGFREPKEDRRYHVTDTRRLWNLLVTVTLHKIIKRVSRGKHRPPDLTALLRKGPGPTDLAIMDEIVEAASASLQREDRRILTLVLAGDPQTEISRALNQPKSVIADKVNRLVERFTRWLCSNELAEKSAAEKLLERLNAGTDARLEDAFQRYVDRLRADPSLAARPPHAIGSGDTRRLWTLLVTVMLSESRRRAAKDNEGELRPLDLDGLLAKGPRPDEVAAITDLIEKVLEGLDDEYRQILMLFLAGAKRTEISRKLGVTYAATKYKVQRLIELARRLLQQADRE